MQKAARVDRADGPLEDALRHRRTWENTEVPACWRWKSGDERLQEPVEAKMKARLGLGLDDDSSLIKTRGQKMRAPMGEEEDDSAEAEAENEDEEEEEDSDVEEVMQKPRSVSLFYPRE